MGIVTYQRGDHALLKRVARPLHRYHPLRYTDFVDHYYGESEHCRLFILIDKHDEVLGSLGLQRMNFSIGGKNVTLGASSNFHAFQSGAGGLLFLHWIKNCDLGLVFGGSPSVHAILRHQKWTWHEGIEQLQINRAYSLEPGQSWWKSLAKRALMNLPPKTRISERVKKMLRDGLDLSDVVEETRFSDDMIPGQSPFAVRFAPDVPFLNWRFNTELPHVRYRLFRILRPGGTAGYVVVNQQQSRLIVAHCDAEDPILLTQGIFAALARVCVGKRRGQGILLASSHELMKESFRRFGFRNHPGKRPLVSGGLKNRTVMPAKTKEWLVNLDWADNGLRAPFLGQSAF